jgi:cyclic-di-AMP phosphodiesterase PgpH
MSSRRPRFTTPLSRARDSAVAFLSRPFRKLSPTLRLSIGFAVLVITCTLLLSSGLSGIAVEEYDVGDVVHRTVISPADITLVDQAETARRTAEVENVVRPVFTFDPSSGETSVRSFRTAWLNLQQQIQDRNADRRNLTWTGEGPEQVGALLASHELGVATLDRLTRLLRDASERHLYRDEDAERLKQEVELVDVNGSGSRQVLVNPRMQMTPVSTARQSLGAELEQLHGWSEGQITALKSVMLPLVKPNVIYDEAATQSARKTAIANLAPSIITLKRNQVVAREGDTVTQPMLGQFRAIREHSKGGRQWHHIFGLLLMVTAILWTAWKFIAHRGTALKPGLSRSKVFALVGSAIVVETVLVKVGFTLADRVATANTNAPFNDPTTWGFAIPFAAGALLIGLLLDTQLAFITALITALFAAVLATPNGVPMAFYALISSGAAIYGIGKYRERQSVTLAGLVAGLFNAVMAIAIITYAQQPLNATTILVSAGCGLLGGLLTIVFTAGGLPVNESAFGILTDVKLLELSNADLPVLGQMALRAPGTNQHSHAVGQLAEEACRAIGANPLLARIGALYHDIGKLAAPHMFIENQRGVNPHDRLRPSNSARIITSHVTYGMKLAKEIGLPQQIADFIPQHHGTRTLHFFLRKAEAQGAEGEVVDPDEFRYPGPKPQFKETAIMMLADSCEAGARSLARPDPENVRAIVSKIVDAVLSDGQLNECDLTLREVTTIRESIISSLIAIYHGRIDYPGFNPPAVTGPLPPLPSGEFKTEEQGVLYAKASEVPVNKSGEVEDEAVSRTRK